ncbi:P-loop containing nucleoside triphosphate hydrolase protein [Cytidiella melzeri]|nr:P-loop containing nucleoside triphosphate hydrolase protein [Cytidiella melzeri]
MHRSLLFRHSSCVRLSSPASVHKAFKSKVAFKQPLNPIPDLEFDSPRRRTSGFRKNPPVDRRRREPEQPFEVVRPPQLHRIPLQEYLAKNVRDWTQQENVRARLITYGIPSVDVHLALSAFATYVNQQDLLSELKYTQEQRDTIIADLSDPDSGVSLDVQLTRLFFEWAAKPIGQAILEPQVDPSTLMKITSLYKAADMSDPAQIFDLTRASPRRKVIMHVGPTNSGKTHNALRALAAAKVGTYCGPLRLLAFEIWERLNKGQIVPLGCEEDVEAEEEDPDTITDASVPGEKPVVRKHGNPKFARACNLVTGDDQRIVDDSAPLRSCTVEMSSSNYSDVAVIDEIQLITDPDRGASWTAALFGTNARELHLCGEESAVPLIERLLQDTGDEFEVHRYSRLSPLTVAKESLRGDYSKVEKGDCVVAFDRSSIYQIRDRVEQETGLRCAVAYGKLPPEVRSQQAALFNDPDSGYDVLVASDAIGMGLNLKIKRMVFCRTAKWDGTKEVTLSAPQIKQIAGRAGRFGLHGSNSPGGIVTTLHSKALPIVREALATPIIPLRKAKFSPRLDQFTQLISALPVGIPASATYEAFHYIGKQHPKIELDSSRDFEETFQHIDSVCGYLSIADRTRFRLAPIRWRDPTSVEAARCLMRKFASDRIVKVREFAEEAGILEVHKTVRERMQKDDTAQVHGLMQKLESSHGTLVSYIWLSYRLPVSFPDREDATLLKEEAEIAMQWCLDKLSTLRHFKKRTPFSKISYKKNKRSFHDKYGQSECVHFPLVSIAQQNSQYFSGAEGVTVCHAKLERYTYVWRCLGKFDVHPFPSFHRLLQLDRQLTSLDWFQHR